MFDEGEIMNNKSMKMEIVVFLYIRNIEVRPVKSGDDTFHHNHTKPYQLSITAISIHNATMPFLEDRDCKPFSACLIIQEPKKRKWITKD